jgi:hypothetical protein
VRRQNGIFGELGRILVKYLIEHQQNDPRYRREFKKSFSKGGATLGATLGGTYTLMGLALHSEVLSQFRGYAVVIREIQNAQSAQKRNS